MAGVSTEQGSNKLDTELNLVPFIDLLSTLVLFLLVTAVWLQIAAIPASVDSKGKAVVSDTPQSKLVVHLTPAGFQLTWPANVAGKISGLPRKAGAYDLERLIVATSPVVKSNPSALAAVSAEDTVDYGWVVQTIDALKTAGFSSVAMSTN